MSGDILVVGPSWVGDMVMAQALFMRLRQRHPDAAIDVLAPGWSLPILAGGLLAAGYMYRVLKPALSDGEISVQSQPRRYQEAIAFALTLIALVLAFAPPAFFDFMEIGRPLADAGRL